MEYVDAIIFMQFKKGVFGKVLQLDVSRAVSWT
jgi:hypothetical protein